MMKKSTSRSGMFSEDTSLNGGHKYDRMRKSDANMDDSSVGSSSVNLSNDFAMSNDNASPQLSPYARSPWSSSAPPPPPADESFTSPCKLMGSLVREEGHIYSLAASGDLLYTGSDSKNIRVWKNQKEFSGFKSQSGLVKTIVIANGRIFSGHQDGKIRMWRISRKNATVYRRVGTLPTLRDYIMCSLKPSNYVEVRRQRSSLWIKHLDAISCLSFSEDKSFLYSASWDKTFKVWRISDSKCMESIKAHDDAVNSLVAGFDGLVFTGSADGTVKVWRRELQGKGTKHFFSQTLLKQECAVTALAVNSDATIIYCGSSDGLVNFWERDKHLSHGGELRGHKLAILCLATAGNLLFSGSADAGICVWRRAGDQHICLTVLTGHSGPVKCLAVEEDRTIGEAGEGRWILYSGSLDKSVKMWRVTDQGPDMHGGRKSDCVPSILMPSPTFAHGITRQSSVSSHGKVQ